MPVALLSGVSMIKKLYTVINKAKARQILFIQMFFIYFISPFYMYTKILQNLSTIQQDYYFAKFLLYLARLILYLMRFQKGLMKIGNDFNNIDVKSNYKIAYFKHSV